MDAEEWVSHVRRIADLPDSEREALVEACRKRGYHVRGPESVPVNPPLWVCRDCLSEFREGEDF